MSCRLAVGLFCASAVQYKAVQYMTVQSSTRQCTYEGLGRDGTAPGRKVSGQRAGGQMHLLCTTFCIGNLWLLEDTCAPRNIRTSAVAGVASSRQPFLLCVNLCCAALHAVLCHVLCAAASPSSAAAAAAASRKAVR